MSTYIKEIEKGVYKVCGTLKYHYFETKNVEVDGEIYSKSELVNTSINLNELDIADWRYSCMEFNEDVLGINYKYYYPNFLNTKDFFDIEYSTNYRINAYINLLKLNGYNTCFGKKWQNTYQEMFESDVIKSDIISYVLDNYGFNNKLYVEIPIREMFEIGLEKFLNNHRVQFYYEQFNEFFEVKNINEIKKTNLAIKLFQSKINYKRKLLRK